MVYSFLYKKTNKGLDDENEQARSAVIEFYNDGDVVALFSRGRFDNVMEISNPTEAVLTKFSLPLLQGDGSEV